MECVDLAICFFILFVDFLRENNQTTFLLLLNCLFFGFLLFSFFLVQMGINTWKRTLHVANKLLHSEMIKFSSVNWQYCKRDTFLQLNLCPNILFNRYLRMLLILSIEKNDFRCYIRFLLHLISHLQLWGKG